MSASKKGQSATDQFPISEQPIRKSPFTISWTHYLVLLTIKDPDERSFYEIEATNAGWSVPELNRQKASCLYERLALSRDKAGIRKLAQEGQVIVRPEDLLKEPLVLEFLGLEEKSGLFRKRPRTGHHQPPGAFPPRTRQRLPLRGPPEALHLRRGPLLRGPRLLQPPPPLLRHHRPSPREIPTPESNSAPDAVISWGKARQAHASGPRPDADLPREIFEACVLPSGDGRCISWGEPREIRYRSPRSTTSMSCAVPPTETSTSVTPTTSSGASPNTNKARCLPQSLGCRWNSFTTRHVGRARTQPNGRSISRPPGASATSNLASPAISRGSPHEIQCIEAV